MVTKKQIVKKLKGYGLENKFCKGNKDVVQKTLDEVEQIKTIYKNYLKWDDIGAELNFWFNKDAINFHEINLAVKSHAKTKPHAIGKK